jgi:hypothetical protein
MRPVYCHQPPVLDGEIIILDAGSGIRLSGLALDKEFGSRSMKLTL